MKKRKAFNLDKFIILIVLLLLCFAGGTLFYVALSKEVYGVNLKEFAKSRNTKNRILHASRGTIYDSDGDALALSVNSYTLIAYLAKSRTTNPDNPQHVVDVETTAKKLSDYLGMDYEKTLGYLKKDAYQVEFGPKGKNLTEIQKKQIEEMELPGIDFIVSTQRYYKMGNFASYIIGYAKTNDTGEINGELGIESYFNESLSGTNGSLSYQSDLYGYQLPNTKVIEVPAQSGSDIYLTIDSNIQLICENALYNLDQEKDFDWGIISVMDANTGAIVASATNPNFNPNDLNTINSYLNPLVSYTYEPGSTMKTFAWAAAIEEGIYDGNATYKSGSIVVDDATIRDWHRAGWGDITFDRGYAMSSNVGATNLSFKLGRTKLHNYYENFGFGDKTGIELSGELKGTINFKYKSEVATAAFGQGITVTPVQMLQAYSAITNDGTIIRPYIVEKIVDNKGNVTYEGKREEVRKVLSTSTVEKMKTLMYDANHTGASKMWQAKTVSLIAKTGTAEIASPKGGYLTGIYDNIYSLAGIFPEENPKYIIYIAVKRIIGAQKDVADMTNKAIDEIAAYANLAGQDNHIEKTKIVTIDNFKSKKTSDIVTYLEANELKPVVLGSGEYIINEYPNVGTKVITGSKVSTYP